MHSFKEFAQHDSGLLAEYLPWSHLCGPGIIEHKDGAYQKSYRFRGPDLDSATKRGLMGLMGAFNNALARLDDGWAIFIEAQRNPTEEYPHSSWPDEASRAIDEERKALFSKEGHNFANNYYLTLVYRAKKGMESRGKAFFLKKEKSEDRYVDDLDTFIKMTCEVGNLLKAIFPEFAPLNDDETLTYLHSTVSSKRHLIKTPEIPMYLDHILTDESIEHGLGLRVGEQTVKTLSIKSFPMESFPGILNSLGDCNFPFRWSTRFLFMGHESAHAELTKVRRVWFSGRKSLKTVVQEVVSQSESGLSETSALNKSADADAALQVLDQGLVRFGYFTATVSVWHNDSCEADARAQQVASIINRLGFACQIESINALDAWLSSIPGIVTANVRKPIIHTFNLAHMAPLSAIWAGEAGNSHLHGPPHFLAKCCGNTPFRFSSNIGDVGHSLIFGPTGAGKSTLLSFMAAQWLRYDGAQVFIFDKGSSSRVLTEAVGGSFYSVGSKSHEFCFQPLRNIDQDSEQVWANEWLLEIFADQGLTIDTELKGELWQALLSLTEQEPSSRTLSVLRSLIQDARARDALSSFCLSGPYGYLFDSDQEKDDSKSWQVFETAELFEQKGALKPALAYLFHRLSRRFDGRPTLLILDEAWLFLEDSVFAKKIKQWLKELRKARVYVIFATQSLADAMQSSIAVAIKESCPTKIFLPNASAQDESSAAFYRGMGLNERQISLIARGLPKREYYVTSPLGNRLFELALGPVSLALCASSSIEDQKTAKQIKDRCGEKSFLKEFLCIKGVGYEMGDI